MKNVKRQFFILLMVICFGLTYAQSSNSLSVFPNPFNSLATINFNIIHSDTVTLEVFNTNGQIIKTFFQSTILPSGSYNIDLLGDSLANGLYFVHLEIGSTDSITKQVIKNGTITNVADNKAVEQVLIYPNPTKNFITIPITGEKTIILTDLNGRIIKSFVTDQQVISLLDIPVGQYNITFLTNKNEIITTQRIIKIE